MKTLYSWYWHLTNRILYLKQTHPPTHQDSHNQKEHTYTLCHHQQQLTHTHQQHTLTLSLTHTRTTYERNLSRFRSKKYQVVRRNEKCFKLFFQPGVDGVDDFACLFKRSFFFKPIFGEIALSPSLSYTLSLYHTHTHFNSKFPVSQSSVFSR